MKELIKIGRNIETGNPVINARDLHTFLEVGKHFSTWLPDKIKKYGFIENVDYTRVFFDIFGNEICSLSNGVYKIEYAITLDMAKELAMVQNNERGRQVRQYFIEVERIYRINHFANYVNRMFLIPCLKKIRVFKTYFLRDINTGHIKIGKSTNVDERIKNFRVINPSIELMTVVNKDIELELHDEYEHKRITGEWFDLTENDLNNIKTKFHE